MECTYCEAELNEYDSYGNSDYILRGLQSGKRGDIFKCPNCEGFETEDEAIAYLKQSGETFESLGISSWEEVVCGSEQINSPGCFHTRGNSEEIYEGHPC